MNNFVEKVRWAASLEDEDKINFQLLEDFFNDKYPDPGTDSHGESYIRNNMSSEDIIEALSEMTELDKSFVYQYMTKSDFRVITDHGKMKWQVFIGRIQ